jgi:hypothetical protein
VTCHLCGSSHIAKETHGFETPLCGDCWCLLGQPEIQPAFLVALPVTSPLFARVDQLRGRMFTRLRQLISSAAMRSPGERHP